MILEEIAKALPWNLCACHLPNDEGVYQVTILNVKNKKRYTAVRYFISNEWNYTWNEQEQYNPNFLIIAWRPLEEPYDGTNY